MDLRRGTALLALPAALAVGCSSSGGASVPDGTPTDASGLGRLLTSAVSHVSSAHMQVDITLAGQRLTGSGAEKLADGKLVGLDLTENLPAGAGAIRVIVVDGTTYAKLPPSLNPSGKPYLLVTSSSSNAVVRQLASALDSALLSASLGSLSTFTKAAKSVEVKNAETIGGVPTTHYAIVVDISKLPADLPAKAELEASGLGTIPLDLYVDSAGRPVRIIEELTVQGGKVSTKSTVTDYNEPVTITAPPANEVGN